MALVKVKPTSPGRRGMVKVVNADLYKGRPHAGLVEAQSKTASVTTSSPPKAWRSAIS
jgi:large subunit ribosomal protein L2